MSTEIELKITGVTPLVYHNPQGADPQHPIVKEISSLTSKKDMTDADEDEKARLQFFLSLYYADDIGLYLPSWNVVACLRKGASQYRQGETLGKAVVIMTDRVAVQHPGPKSPEKMWERPEFRWRTGVAINRGRVISTRPIFRTWSLSVPLVLVEDQLSFEDFDRAATTAGRIAGLGDARKLGYGRFTATVVRQVEQAA